MNLSSNRNHSKTSDLLFNHCVVFIHFYSASHGMSLSEAIPTTAIDTVSEFYTPKRYKQLQVKALPKVPKCRLERDSKPRPPVERPRLYQCATMSNSVYLIYNTIY